ncbi:MAG: SLBB domain-containing protein [Oleispira sp.]|nr:SLBB domain-containing protein [Oleispira sp.]
MTFKVHPLHRKIAFIAIVASLTGCSTLPAFGPSSDAITNAAIIEQADVIEQEKYLLVDLSLTTLPHHSDHRPKIFSTTFTDQQILRADERIIPGDKITIRIWEGADDGLFAHNGQREVSLTLTVSNSGMIEVPYAGSVLVENRSTEKIRELLLKRYRGKAVTPEISVQILETNSRGVSVMGAVATPGRINIPAHGINLLDLLALAGGTPNPAWECTLKLTRNGTSETIALDWLFANADNNVVVLPGDIVHVDHAARTFAVYGAVTRPGSINIQKPAVRLNDLLAGAGGLDNMQAEASSVFVFRLIKRNETASNNAGISYRLNMSRPDAFLLASQFEVEDTDIVYVATADASEFRKFVTTLLSPFFGSVGGVRNLGN